MARHHFGPLLFVKGDVMRDDTALAPALRVQDVVISTFGRGKSLESGGPIETSMPRIVVDMVAAGVRWPILTSAFGVGETIRDVPLLPRRFIRARLQDFYGDKNSGGQILRSSELDWTLVYPLGLCDRPGTGRYRVADRLSLSGCPLIARAGVADFLLKKLEDPTYVRRGVLVGA